MRQHLLDAALRCFASRGYEGTSTRRIAEEADVSSSLLYHYFPGKEAILLALFDRSISQIMAAFARVQGEEDPRRRVALLARVSADIIRKNLDFWRVSYGVRMQHAVVAGLGERARQEREGAALLWATLLRQAGSPQPEIDGALMTATFDGVFQHFVLDPEGYPLDAVLEAALRRVVDLPLPPSEDA